MTNENPMTRRSAIRAGALLLAGAATLTACSEHQDPTGPETPGPAVEVDLLDSFRFSPAELRVEAGTTVRWRNTTSNFHTVTPDGHSAWSEWQTAGAGETFEVTFDVPGTYPYYCRPHRSLGMTGTITVE